MTSTPGRCSSAKITALAMSSSLQRPLAGAVVEERGVGHPRLDQGDADRVVLVHLAQLGAQRLADRGRRPLGRRVERAGQRAPPGDRAGDEEVAVAALEQVGEGGADRQRHAVDVGEDHRAPVLRRLLEEAALAPKPALAKTASIRPKRSSAAAAIASTWSHSVTSQRTASARSSPPSSAANASSCSTRRAASTKPVAPSRRARRSRADPAR